MDFLKELEKLLEEGEKITKAEYEKLPKKCPKCGGELMVMKQEFKIKPNPGDRFTLKCKSCGFTMTRFIPYPEDYALFFKQMKELVDGL